MRDIGHSMRGTYPLGVQTKGSSLWALSMVLGGLVIGSRKGLIRVSEPDEKSGNKVRACSDLGMHHDGSH